MADVEIPITGEIQSSDEKLPNSKRFDFSQLALPPLGQITYPQAQEWVQQKKANVKPWALFLNSNNFRPPPSITRLSKRVLKNLEYFQSNYLFVSIILIVYVLITSPLLLIAVAGSLGICYKISQRHTSIFNNKLTLPQVYTLIGICCLPLFYLVGAGGAIFWVLGVSCFLITIHASFYNIDSVLCPGEDELNLLQEV